MIYYSVEKYNAYAYRTPTYCDVMTHHQYHLDHIEGQYPCFCIAINGLLWVTIYYYAGRWVKYQRGR